MYYFILILTLLITLGSQSYINSMYNKTKNIPSKSKITGAEVARRILDENGLKRVKVVKVDGVLSDHYNPKTRTVNLSKDIYENTSLASISVASHECGHALQDREGYAFLRFRNSIVPIVNLASRVGYVIIMISIVMSLLKLLWIGILMECIILVFQLVTLPVEFNASHRALYQIQKLNMVGKEEHTYCKKMLKAAALTYVAAVATAIIEVLRLVLIARRND